MRTISIVLSAGLVIALHALSSNSDVAAQPVAKNSKMPPTPSELLHQPLDLKLCAEMQVIEWRATPGFERSTGPSTTALLVLNRTCQTALSGFKRFVISEGFEAIPIHKPFKASVCLMPAVYSRSGTDYRNLNDVEFRFSAREKEYTDDGRLFTIWGWTEHKTLNIYIRNDVLNDDGASVNRDFVTVFAHEIFHALSWHTGLYLEHVGTDKAAADEAMAQRFTKFLNL